MTKGKALAVRLMTIPVLFCVFVCALMFGAFWGAISGMLTYGHKVMAYLDDLGEKDAEVNG